MTSDTDTATATGATGATGAVGAGPLELAAELEAQGRRLDAIQLLTEANRAEPQVAIEQRLSQLRFDAWTEMVPASAYATWPHEPAPIPRDRSGTIPETTSDHLSAAALREAMLGHGCLRVNGLLPPATVDALVGGIDQAFDTRSRITGPPGAGKGTNEWYKPVWVPENLRQQLGRAWVGNGGGLLTADSPRNLFTLTEAFRAAGLYEVLGGYLGERPWMSASKCTLRRVPVDSGSGWHQDGAFLGPGVRACNVWIALSHCGHDAPSLDVVPRRFDEVVETGTGGALFDWTVGPELIERFDAETPVQRPVFAPGDALLFDDLFLHRTGVSDGMTRERYAIENWFFAPTGYPERQVPFAW